MTRYQLDRIELGARASWLLLRDGGVTRVDTWLAHWRDVPWLHKGQEVLL